MIMKKTAVLLLSVYGLVGCVLVQTKDANKIILTQNNQSDYCIVVSAQAETLDLYAAEELQTILHTISGTTLPIVRNDEDMPALAIFVGRNRHVEKLGVDPDPRVPRSRGRRHG